MPIDMLTVAFMPSMVASPDANCPSVELIVVPVPIPPAADGLILPPPLAVRLLMLIFVTPVTVPVVPIELPTVAVAGTKADRLIAVRPAEEERLVLAPKLVELPTLSDVRMPIVTERFSVSPLAGARVVVRVGLIADCS